MSPTAVGETAAATAAAAAAEGALPGTMAALGAVPQHVRLVSCDGVSFVVEREAALYSRTLAMFLDPELGWQEGLTGEVHLRDINGHVLERVCSFLDYRRRYDGTEQHPPWDVREEESLDILLVADYLEM